MFVSVRRSEAVETTAPLAEGSCSLYNYWQGSRAVVERPGKALVCVSLLSDTKCHCDVEIFAHFPISCFLMRLAKYAIYYRF